MTAPSGVASARRLIDGFMAADVASAAEAFHPDCVIREADGLPYGGDWKGKDGFLELIGVMSKAFDVTINGYDVYEAGENTVVMRARTTFRARRGGPTLDTAIVELYTIKDGLILEADVYPKDTLAIARLLDQS